MGFSPLLVTMAGIAACTALAVFLLPGETADRVAPAGT
jgi:hypothetical protein